MKGPKWTAAATALVVLLGSLSLTTPAGAETDESQEAARVTLEAGRNRIVHGQKVRLTGTIDPPVEGETVRIVDGNGTEDTADDVPGQDRTFRTAGPPAVSGQLASNVTPSQATVSATINTKGLRTAYRIQWGSGTGYGRFTPVQWIETGSATATVAGFGAGHFAVRGTEDSAFALELVQAYNDFLIDFSFSCLLFVAGPLMY
jgi:hypothetical protein